MHLAASHGSRRNRGCLALGQMTRPAAVLVPSPVTMTERLAYDLTTRFFEDIGKRLERGEQTLRKKSGGIKTRQQFTRFAQELFGFARDHSLASYLGGSKRHPYFALDLLDWETSRPFNSWNERCLTGHTLLVSYEPRYHEVEPTLYNVGEHAIARIFYRTQPLVDRDTSRLSVNHIIEEMRQIPFWAGFWVMALLSTNGADFWGSCEPLIPSPNGVFLCSLHPGSKRIEVRTFVEDAQLSEPQLRAKRLLLSIGQRLASSPMSFWLGIDHARLDDVDALLFIVSRELHRHEDFQYLASCLFHRIDDDRERQQFKARFTARLKALADWIDPKLAEALEILGIREFHQAIKTHSMRHAGRQSS